MEVTSKIMKTNDALAKAYEEKSLLAIARGNKFASENAPHIEANNEYRHALLYALEAKKYQVPDGKLSLSSKLVSQLSTIPSFALDGEIYQTPHLDLDSTEAITYSPDGKVIAVGAWSYIQLWDAQKGHPIKTLKGHSDSEPVPGWGKDIQAITYSPNGKIIASGACDQVRLWNAESFELITTLEGHSCTVRALAFSPDGNTLASGADDLSVRLWDTQSHKLIKTVDAPVGEKEHYSAIQSLAFAPDGKNIITGTRGGGIQLWDAHSLALTNAFEKIAAWQIITLAYSADGKIIASNDGNNIHLLDSITGSVIKTLEGHSGCVNTISYSPDGKIIASGSDDTTIRLWDAQSFELITILETHSGCVNTLAFSPDNKIIISGAIDYSIRFWDIQSYEAINTVGGHTHEVLVIAYSPDGKIMASGSQDKSILLWNAQTLKTLHQLQGGQYSGVCDLAFSPDSQYLFSSDGQSNIRRWCVKTGRLVNTKECDPPINGLTLSPNGNILAYGSEEFNIQLFDAHTFESIKLLKGHSSSVYEVVFSPNSQLLASGSENGTIRIWDVQSGAMLTSLDAHTDWIETLAFSPDGLVLTSTAGDNSMQFWSTQTFEVISKTEGTFKSLAYNSDGKLLAVALSNAVKLLDSQSLVCVKALQCQPYEVNTIALHPDGNMLAIGTNDGSIRLWNTQTGESSNSAIDRLMNDFDAAEVSDALCFLWDLGFDELSIINKPKPQALLPQFGRNIAWTDEIMKYRPLLEMPQKGETKIDQVVHWLEERL